MAFRKPKDYDDIRTDEYRILPAGGYICRILKAEECVSSTGKDMLKVAFDICDGNYNGYFMDQFQDRKAAAEDPTAVKWPFSGTKWILFYDNEGATSRNFKSFCTALKESGAEVWKKDELNLKGIKDSQVGIIFRREEQEYQGKTSWRTVPLRFTAVSKIEEGGFRVPEDKPLNKAPLDFTGVDSFSAAEEDIPF